jgi:hypothetical protein
VDAGAQFPRRPDRDSNNAAEREPVDWIHVLRNTMASVPARRYESELEMRP